MKNRRTSVTVPLSQSLRLGRRDAHATLRDSLWDTRGTAETITFPLLHLRRDRQRDGGGTRIAAECPTGSHRLGQSGTVEK